MDLRVKWAILWPVLWLGGIGGVVGLGLWAAFSNVGVVVFVASLTLAVVVVLAWAGWDIGASKQRLKDLGQ